MIKIELINGVPCISNVEITRTAAKFYYDEAADKDFDFRTFYEALLVVIKNHIIRLEPTMAKHIHKRDNERWIDKAAFFELSQVYKNGEQQGLDEGYTQSILAELGEFYTPIRTEAAA